MAYETAMAAGGPIFLGVLIALGTVLNWPKWTNYLWAAIAIIWGVIAWV